MRPEPNFIIEPFRRVHPTLGASKVGASWGFFIKGSLRIISSGDTTDNPVAKGWEHVSVSLFSRCPTWGEMAEVKKLFWGEEETVIQFHPRKSAHINEMPHCLHLWKLTATEYLLPPKELIGSL
jgi:hypothetical protein